MSTIVAIKSKRYSCVLDSVITDATLSFRARVVLIWMLGQSKSFELRIAHIQRLFDMSEVQWLRVRKELLKAGYFAQERYKTPIGTFTWRQWVFDSPRDKPPHQKPWDGLASHGQQDNALQGDAAASNGDPSPAAAGNINNTTNNSTNNNNRLADTNPPLDPAMIPGHHSAGLPPFHRVKGSVWLD